jgi:hypothetical protein
MQGTARLLPGRRRGTRPAAHGDVGPGRRHRSGQRAPRPRRPARRRPRSGRAARRDGADELRGSTTGCSRWGLGHSPPAWIPRVDVRADASRADRAGRGRRLPSTNSAPRDGWESPTRCGRWRGNESASGRSSRRTAGLLRSLTARPWATRVGCTSCGHSALGSPTRAATRSTRPTSRQVGTQAQPEPRSGGGSQSRTTRSAVTTSRLRAGAEPGGRDGRAA